MDKVNPDVRGLGGSGVGVLEWASALIAGWIIGRFVIYTFDIDRWIAYYGNQVRQLLGMQPRSDGV